MGCSLIEVLSSCQENPNRSNQLPNLPYFTLQGSLQMIAFFINTPRVRKFRKTGYKKTSRLSTLGRVLSSIYLLHFTRSAQSCLSIDQSFNTLDWTGALSN